MASKLYARFSTNENKEEGGVWVDFGDGIRIKVRRITCRKSQDVRTELSRPLTTQVRKGPLPEDVTIDLMLKQLAQGVIADWEGIDLGDGVAVPYTPDNAYKLLKDLPELRDSVLQVSTEAEHYRNAVVVDTEKNLSNTSDGV